VLDYTDKWGDGPRGLSGLLNYYTANGPNGATLREMRASISLAPQFATNKYEPPTVEKLGNRLRLKISKLTHAERTSYMLRVPDESETTRDGWFDAISCATFAELEHAQVKHVIEFKKKSAFKTVDRIANPYPDLKKSLGPHADPEEESGPDMAIMRLLRIGLILASESATDEHLDLKIGRDLIGRVVDLEVWEMLFRNLDVINADYETMSNAELRKAYPGLDGMSWMAESDLNVGSGLRKKGIWSEKPVVFFTGPVKKEEAFKKEEALEWSALKGNDASGQRKRANSMGPSERRTPVLDNQRKRANSMGPSQRRTPVLDNKAPLL